MRYGCLRARVCEWGKERILGCTGSDLAHPQSVEASVLLPEQPAPALGVKSSGLHFLTAGDQGVGDWPHVDQGLGEACGPHPSTALVILQGSFVCGRLLLGSVYTPSHKCQAYGRN